MLIITIVLTLLLHPSSYEQYASTNSPTTTSDTSLSVLPILPIFFGLFLIFILWYYSRSCRANRDRSRSICCEIFGLYKDQ